MTTTTTTTTVERPTVVLVHGAFAESSSWTGVIEGLLADGFAVIALANPCRGVAPDAAYLSSVIEHIDGDVLIAGHSYGGAVMSNIEEGKEKVKALVFVGGFAPDRGESGAQLAGRYEGGTLGDTLETVALPDGSTDLYIRQSRYHVQFAADSSPQSAAVMAVTQRPILETALNDLSGNRLGARSRRGSCSAQTTGTSPSRCTASWPNAPARAARSSWQAGRTP